MDVKFLKIFKKFIFIIFLINSTICEDFNCIESPIYKNLEISTNLYENSHDYNVIIMKECKVNENWRVKEDILKQCVIRERVFEGEDNIRRSFRFTYKKNADFKEKIVIKSISTEYPKNIAETSITKENFSLSPGESIDIFIDYDCKDMDETKRLSQNWFKLRMNIEFGNKSHKSFEFIKICTASYSDKLDLSHIVIIGIVFLIVYSSTNDYLKSKVEVIIVEKYSEIKNPENLSIISILIGLILIFLWVIEMLHIWVYICILFIGPLSVAMIIEALFRRNNILLHLETKSYEISYIGSITMFFLVCLSCGFIILFLWIETNNWLINNILATSISIITIRIFKFTSFKFILMIYIIALVYDCIWVAFKSNYYGENFKLTNNSPTNLPVHIFCPELLSSPFSSCNYLPISDIILPGIFLAYSKKVDEFKYIQDYFYVGIGSLAAGLFLNLVIFYYIMLPTPSFLFTGPLILMTTLFVAFRRQELYELIEGFSSTIYVNKTEENLNKYFEKQRKHQDEYRPPNLTNFDGIKNYEDETIRNLKRDDVDLKENFKT